MNVDVDSLKLGLVNKIQTIYNQDVFFIDGCIKFPMRYSLVDSSSDLQLQIFFEENNKIFLGGKCLKYCDKDGKKTIKLASISDEVSSPDINIVNNYIIEDRWEKTEW